MNQYTTSDLPLAAFLMMRGLKLVSAGRSGNKFEFILEDPDNLGNSLTIEYINSEFGKFDTYLRSLKKMLYRP